VKHQVPEELRGVLGFVGAIWAVYLAGLVAPFDTHRFGITPRTMAGLMGIPLAPFLHASLQHLLSNTVPLFVLLTLLAGSRARSWAVVIELILLSGGLLWLFGRRATHLGASMLIFGLVAFLIVSGVRERRIIPLLIALLVGFLYGGTLVAGVLPQLGSQVSWDGHLCGAIAGGIVGFVATRRGRPDARHSDG
jgi:membrane associated rhomboid family serine protease